MLQDTCLEGIRLRCIGLKIFHSLADIFKAGKPKATTGPTKEWIFPLNEKDFAQKFRKLIAFICFSLGFSVLNQRAHESFAPRTSAFEYTCIIYTCINVSYSYKLHSLNFLRLKLFGKVCKEWINLHRSYFATCW